MTKDKKTPLFSGNDTLKQFIVDNIEKEAYSDYPLDNIEDFDFSGFSEEDAKQIKEELDTLVKETKEKGFDYVRIGA